MGIWILVVSTAFAGLYSLIFTEYYSVLFNPQSDDPSQRACSVIGRPVIAATERLHDQKADDFCNEDVRAQAV